MNGPSIIVSWITVFSIHTIGGYGLQCFNCNNVQDITQCNNDTQCGISENCFIERYGNLPYATFKLGCLEHEHCPAQPSQSFTLVGRAVHSNKVPACRECCTTDRCNNKQCNFQLSAPSITTASPCDDHESNCPHLNSTLHVCTDVQNARKLCRKYCGLCILVDGAWNVWSEWSKCSVSCGRGTVSRMRICNNPSPSHGGLLCAGNTSDTKSCHLRECPVHGGWTIWSSWGSCNTKCGLGLSKRNRTCTNPTPTLFGNYCFGDNVDTKICNDTDCMKATSSRPPTTPTACSDTFDNCDALNTTLAICADTEKARAACKNYCGLCLVVDGHWTYWSHWKQCSVTCGNGTTSRARTCTSPSPTNGGHLCVGPTLETKVCNDRECPVHGGWSMWNSWTTCTATCGTGLTHRRRDCDNPSPSVFGTYCYGDSTEYNLCVVTLCSVDGNWGIWTSWSTCSSTCGQGTAIRTRGCNAPTPANGGSQCSGRVADTKTCNLRNCPTISFSVHTPSSSSYSTGQAIVFRRVINNDGGGYSTTTGKFTAPVDGKYVFSLTVMNDRGASVSVFLKRSNATIGQMYTDGSSAYDTNSFTYVLDLHHGDTVWAMYISGSVYAEIHSSFTGFLIHP